MERFFDHEKLDVYRAAIEFVVLVDEIIATLPRGRAYLADQIQRAASALSRKFLSLGRAGFEGERRLEDAVNHAWLARPKPKLPRKRCRCK